MGNFLQQQFFGNRVQDYLWVAGVILFVLILSKFISRYVAVLLCKLIRRKWKAFDEQVFINLVIHPLSVFLVITVSIVALYSLRFPPELRVSIYRYPLQRIFLTIGIIIQIVALTWLLLRIVDFVATVLERRANRTPDFSDNQLIVFFRDLIKVIFAIIGLLLILHFAFKFNISSLVTGLSIVGAAIALALRESLENLIASFVIFFDKPFTTGDLVRVQNVTGHVEKIGLRSTRIRTTDKSYVTVPNKQMVDSILDNVSLRSQIRGELNLFIKLETPPAKIEELLIETKEYLSKVEEIQKFNVLFNDIRLQAFVVLIEFFTIPIEWGKFNEIKQQLNFFVLQTMEKMDIKVAA
ncbi:MAG: mechanosensitive ion channel [Chitinophagaceae bacterium]|nr:mechanosensitive ion channel [Chitinophagaceae bacterium]